MNTKMANGNGTSRVVRGSTIQGKDNMAFVNEIIPEEEKAKFTFPVSTQRDGSKPTLYMWTIDRKRNAFLVHTKSDGGSYEGTPEEMHYVLSWHGSLINFIGTYAIGGNLDEGYVISWHLRELVLPPELKMLDEDAFALIREAMDVMGLRFNRTRIAAVNVHFDLPSANYSGSQP